MAYTPTNWTDRVVQYVRRYRDELNNQKTFTPDEGTITNAGTPFSAANMNKIEDELVVLDNGQVNLSNAILLTQINMAKEIFDINATSQASRLECIDFFTDLLNDATAINSAASSRYVYDAVNKGVKFLAGSGSYTQGNTTKNTGLELSATYSILSESFTVSTTTPITKLKFEIYSGSGTGVLNLKLESSSGGFPTGNLAGANTKKDSISVSANTVYEITLDAPFTPTIGTIYHMVLECVSGSMQVSANTLSAPYANGMVSQFSSVWTAYSAIDLYFGVYQQDTITVASIVFTPISYSVLPAKAFLAWKTNGGSGTVRGYYSFDESTWLLITADTITILSAMGTPAGNIYYKLEIDYNASETIVLAIGGGWRS